MNSDENKLAESFLSLTHGEKFEKIMIYLHAMQKSAPDFIGLYSIVEELGEEGVDDDILINLYSTLIGIVHATEDEAKLTLQKLQNQLAAIKQQEKITKEQEIKELQNLEEMF